MYTHMYIRTYILTFLIYYAFKPVTGRSRWAKGLRLSLGQGARPLGLERSFLTESFLHGVGVLRKGASQNVHPAMFFPGLPELLVPLPDHTPQRDNTVLWIRDVWGSLPASFNLFRTSRWGCPKIWVPKLAAGGAQRHRDYFKFLP